MRTEESTSLCDIKFKIVFLGDMGVGKTSIIERFVKDEFEDVNNVNDLDIQPTVGIDFFSRNLTHNNSLYRLQLWDTAGQEKYKSLVPAYLRDAHCAVFVMDATRKETFQNLHSWLELFRNNQSEKAISFLICNKKDLSDDRRVPKEEVEQFVRKQGMGLSFVSAKTGAGIMETFKKITEILISREIQQDEYKELSKNFFEKYAKLRGTQERNENVPCCYI